MPSTAPPANHPVLRFYKSAMACNSHVLIVVTAGFTANSSLEFCSKIHWFMRAGNVLTVDHPETDFSLRAEAEQIIPYIKQFQRVYFVGLSLGARLSTEVLDQLENSPLRLRVKGVLSICGINQPSDFNGLSPRLWPLFVWPLTAPWVNRWQAASGDRKNPGPPWQVSLMPHHAEAIEYGFEFPGSGRRAQVRGISQLLPLVPGRYADIPMVYLATPDDQVLHPVPASSGWHDAFGDNGSVVWFPSGVVRHCSLNEHPFSWAGAIGKVFTSWGILLSERTLSIPMQYRL